MKPLACLRLSLAVSGATACRIVSPVLQGHERAQWAGPCKNGYADGIGLLRWYLDNQANGDRYEGYWKDGLRDGPGSQD